MLRLFLPILVLAGVVCVCGCGTITCMNMAQENPRTEVIYGGVRTDVNCIIGNRVEPKRAEHVDYFSFGGIGECVLKTCSIIDLPLSFVADTVMLPHAIWMTLHKPPPQTEMAKPAPSEAAPKTDEPTPPTAMDSPQP